MKQNHIECCSFKVKAAVRRNTFVSSLLKSGDTWVCGGNKIWFDYCWTILLLHELRSLLVLRFWDISICFTKKIGLTGISKVQKLV